MSFTDEKLMFKKYFVLAFDDGITQDKKIMDICKKYNYRGCTFFINSDLLGANWQFVGESMGKPEVTHLRFTRDEILSGVYDGFNVEAHTLNHPALKDLDNNPEELKRQVQNDVENICKLTCVMPLGMAWPGGDDFVTDITVENVRKYTSIRYARGTTPTYDFNLPRNFLRWYPTCSITDDRLTELKNRFLTESFTDNAVFFVWGHGYELDAYDLYDKLECLIKDMTSAEDIMCVSTRDFYLLFNIDD